MLVLHALSSPRRGPLIWGHYGDRPLRSVSQAVRSPRAQPFAAEATMLAEVHAGKPVTAALLLPSPAPVAVDSLLDQVPATEAAIRGHGLVDLLRPVYQALGEAAAPEARDAGRGRSAPWVTRAAQI